MHSKTLVAAAVAGFVQSATATYYSSEEYYTPPAYSTPAYTPPAYSTPAYTPPAYTPPAYTTPAYTPPAYTPPAYTTPAYTPPAYTPPVYSSSVYTPPPVYSSPVYSSSVYTPPPVYTTPAYSSAVYSAPPAYSSAPAYEGGNVEDMVTVVEVGPDGELVFNPPNVNVPVGSHIQFNFNPENHSVVQASFDAPCVPINNVDKTVQGFFSGFMPAASSAETLVFDIQVTTSDPIWFYCSQDTHCQGGMVGSINAPLTGDKSLEEFAAKAAGVKDSLTPGSYPPGVMPPPGAYPTGGYSAPPPPPVYSSAYTSAPPAYTPPVPSPSSSFTSVPAPPAGTAPPPAGSSQPPVGDAARLGAMGLGLTWAAALLLL